MRALAPTLALALALAGSRAHAQHDARATAERIHREGRYADDLVLEADGPAEDGAGRGPRGELRLDPDRQLTPSQAPVELPDWLRDLFRSLEALFGAAAQSLGWVFLGLGLTVLAALLAYLVARIRLPIPPATASPASAGPGGSLDPLLLTPSRSAEELAAEGRWGEAIHALFVRSLDRLGGEERHRASTARELVRRVPGDRPGKAPLEELLGMTELVWFGGREATEEEYRNAVTLSATVEALPSPGAPR